MARAELDYVERKVVTIVKDEVVRLTLTPAEAETLIVLLNHVGGRPQGRRGHTDAVQSALIDAVGMPKVKAYQDVDKAESTRATTASKLGTPTIFFKETITSGD